MRRRVQAGIVVALLLTCAGLMLPNVAHVRESAALLTCQNSSKQLGIGWLNYIDAKGHTIAGTHSNSNLQPERRLSWVFTLSPYIEQDFIRRSVDPSLSWDDDKNRPITGQQWLFFSCPASPNYRYDLRLTYLGVAGVGADAATLPADNPRIGAFGYDRTLKIDEFTDGQSNTMLILETRSGGPWAQGGPGTVRGLDPSNRPHHGDGRPFDGEHRLSRWFKRTTTVTLTWCDGSVRTVRDSVAPEVLEALATVRGKEELPEEW